MKKILKILVPILIVVAIGIGGFFGFSYYRSIKGDSKTVVYNDNGTYAEEEVLNDVVVNASSAELRNKTIEGTLTIKSEGSHDILLRNVAVGGDIIIEDAKQEYTVILSNVSCRNVKIDCDVPVNIKVMDSTVLTNITTDSSVSITENLDTRSEGVKNVIISSNAQMITDEEGNEVSDGGSEVSVSLYNTGLDSLTVSSPASVYLSSNSIVENMTTNSQTNLINEGSVGLLTANANTIYLNKPASSVVKDGVDIRSQEEVVYDNEHPETNVTDTTTTTKKKTTTTTTEEPEVTTTKKTTTTKRVTTTTTTTKKVNYPIISCDDLVVMVGNTVNPLNGVTCTDTEDGKIAIKSSHISANTVNTSQPGTYSITYTVTDKDGNTTTKVRKVVVEEDPNKLSAPTNLDIDYNNEGDLIVTWDKVADAYDYSVFVNGKNVIKSVSTNSAKITNYINLKKENTISVSAAPSPSSSLKESVQSSITFNYTPGTMTLPTSTTVGTKMSGTYEFSPLYVNTRAINRIIVTVEKYVDREYEPVADVRVGTKLTDEDGIANITNYARGESNISFEFNTSGAYRVTLELDTDSGNEIVMSEVVDVYNSDGTLNSSGEDLAVEDFYVNYRSSKKWSVNLLFKTAMNVDFRDSWNDLDLQLVFTTSDGSEVSTVYVDLYDAGLNKKILYSGETITIKVDQGDDDISGIDELYDYLNADTEEEPRVYASGTLKVSAGSRANTTVDYEVELPKIRFN